MGDSYEGRFFCSNCNWDGMVQVEKGTRLTEAAEEMECTNCGCENTISVVQ